MASRGILLLLCASILHVPALHAAPPHGLVLEAFGQESILEKSGLQRGDTLLSWEREADPPANPVGATGRLESYFDWFWLVEEQAPRGVIRLSGERAGKPWKIEIPAGSWRAVVRPSLDEATLAHYETLQGLAKKNEWDAISDDLVAGESCRQFLHQGQKTRKSAILVPKSTR
jgi:hypothetical protein